MVTEWLEGKLLRELLSEKEPLGVERAVHITTQLCCALDHIHSHGIAHRDLKPENVMIAPDGDVKLMDFGIASLAGCRRLTFGKFSEVMGSPDYISPEQVSGKRGDARSDIFALGVMLYEMLTGKTPFSGSNAYAIMNDRLRNDPVAPRRLNSAISPELQEALRRALEREPKNRYSSIRDFASDLEHPELVMVAEGPEASDWQQSRPRSPRRWLSYAGLALIPMLVFGLLLYVSQHP
jgi:serine/threonine-protein kinase